MKKTEMHDVVSSYYTKSLEETNKLLIKYLGENPVIKDFIDKMDAELYFITTSESLVFKNGFHYEIQNNIENEGELNLVIYPPVKDEFREMGTEEVYGFVEEIVAEFIPRLKSWIRETEYPFEKIVIEPQPFGIYQGVYKIIEALENDDFFCKLSNIKDVYFVIQPNKDVLVPFADVLATESEIQKQETLEQLALISASLIRFDIDSVEDCLEDEGSVELTKCWVKERIENMELFLELVQVDEISKADLEFFKDALKNISQFKNGDDFWDYREDLKNLMELKRGNDICFEGFEGEEVTFTLSEEVIQLIEEELNIEDLSYLRAKYKKSFDAMRVAE